MAALKPTDLPEGSAVLISVEDGIFLAEFFPLRHDPYRTGRGQGATIEEAIREALDEAGE
jgi:hypothetical protein